MTVTKIPSAIATLVLVGGVIGLVWQQRTIAAWRETSAGFQRQLAGRAVENARMAEAQTRAAAELKTLRAELAGLKAAVAAANDHAPAATATTAAAALPAGELRTGSALPYLADTEVNRQKKAQDHRRYDSFFAQRELTPGQVARILDLFILQDEAREDLQALVREKGVQGNALGVEEIRSKLYAPILRELQDILGEDGYTAYIGFEQSSYYRVAFVERLLPTFTSANAALSPRQTDQLVAIVAANDHQTSIGSRSQVDWDMVARQSTAFLTSDQQAALQDYAARHKSNQSP